jgi:hypothetical protein
LDNLFKFINVIASVIQAIAAGIAIYLFIFKRDKIRSLFNLLINYSFQTTLSELKVKLEKLNDYDAGDPDYKHIVSCVLNEIEGQIRGNDILSDKCTKIMRKISIYTKNPEDLTEPKKRSLISELRETLRNIDLQRYDELMRRWNNE